VTTKQATSKKTTTTAAPTIEARKAALLEQLRAIEEEEEQQQRAQAQAAGQRAAIAQVAIVQLRPRYQALLAAACAVEEQIAQAREVIRAAQPQQPSTTQTTTTSAPQTRPDGKPNHFPMRFYQAYRTRYKGTATQRQVTAACRAAKIDQSDRSPENLARAHAALRAQGTIA
jgi:hypothetical protein